jgi:hypothetical protein
MLYNRNSGTFDFLWRNTRQDMALQRSSNERFGDVAMQPSWLTQSWCTELTQKKSVILVPCKVLRA